MLLLTVRTVRRLAGVFKRCRRREVPTAQVRFLGGPAGLKVRFAQPDVALECVLPGPHPAEDVTLPLAHLTQCKGRPDDPVTLEQAASGGGLLRWQDHGFPQVQEWTCPPETGGPFDALPKLWASNSNAILYALDEAAHCTEVNSSRYALDLIQLRGGAGEIVATDGRQLLVQDGFRFPWRDDLLLPAAKLFGNPDLRATEEVRIGRVDDLVVLQGDAWTCWLRVDKERRFPATDRVVPDPARAACRLRLHGGDAAFLAGNLRRLPGAGSEQTPVTIDLNGHVSLRTREESGRMAEVVLDRSTYEGPAQQICLPRSNLARILDLKLDTMHLFEPGQPIHCSGPGRRYVVVPLVAQTAVPPSEDCLRLHTQESTAQENPPPPPKENPMPDVPASSPNGHETHRRRSHAVTADGDSTPSLLEEVQSLRDALRDALDRCGKVLTRIREQRKQSRLVNSTLASLRQLQAIDA